MCGNVLQDIISNSAELQTVFHLYAVVMMFVNLYVLDFGNSLSPVLISLLPPFAVPTTLTEVFLNLTEVFPCFFLSCKANARVKLAKTGHGPHSSTLFVICVVRLLFVLFYVLFVCKCVLPLGDNPIAVNKYII